jgi:hypothetical protein
VIEMTRHGQEVLEVFGGVGGGKSGNRIITCIICIIVISKISVINVKNEIMGVKCNNAYNVVIRVLFYNYIRAKGTCVIMVL